MFQTFDLSESVQKQIDKYKNETLDNLTFDEIKGLTKNIFENICINENIWSEEFVNERNDPLNPLQDIMKNKLNVLFKKLLDDTALTNETKKYIIEHLLDELNNFLIENTIY